MTLQVIDPGARTLIQDLGRSGVAALGVSPSGAADRGAHRLANRLLGNDTGAATLEVLNGGLVLQALEPVVVAVAGAPVPLTVAGRPAPCFAAVPVDTGQQMRLGRPEAGLRSYVAVAGGLAVPAVLGSRSTDTLAGLGPAPLVAGDIVQVGHGPRPRADRAGLPRPLAPDAQLTALLMAAAFRMLPQGEARLQGTWGPRADWFTAAARRALTSVRWEVSLDSDRVGVRCSGPCLERAVPGELASEATVRGSVQVPPSGQPVILLADHPVTGGYPVIAVLDPAAVDAAAQVRPGDGVRFELAPPAYPTDLA